MYVVAQLKNHHTYCGGLANAKERMDHRWRFRQWVDDDPLAPPLRRELQQSATATPHPVSVYPKLNDCQVSVADKFVREARKQIPSRQTLFVILDTYLAGSMRVSDGSSVSLAITTIPSRTK
jgi:hypothetical protein